MKQTYGVCLAAVMVVASAAAQQAPVVKHAEISTHAASSLRAEIEAAKREQAPLWIGYAVPVTGKFQNNWDGDRVDYLEGTRHDDIQTDDDKSKPSFDHTNVLLRVGAGAVEKVHVERPDRELDAGGLKFVWLTGVREEESIAVLTEFARFDGRRLRDSAVFALAVHKSDAATQALVGLAAAKEELGLREKAAFWLAVQREGAGFEALKKFAHEDADAKFREKLTFDLTLTKQPGAVDELLWLAKNDAEPRVRKQAQFWLATTAQRKIGKAVPEALRDAAANDPNTQVRQSAVFALSRLPGDESATQLIELAKTSKDFAVRKQAVFWLGQSKDPRALAYLEQVLKQ